MEIGHFYDTIILYLLINYKKLLWENQLMKFQNQNLMNFQNPFTGPLNDIDANNSMPSTKSRLTQAPPENGRGPPTRHYMTTTHQKLPQHTPSPHYD